MKDLFGTLKNIRYLTIYKFQIRPGPNFAINSYDSDFKEWDDPTMVLEPGAAIWILNTGQEYTYIPFKGYIPNNWRRLSD